MANQILVINAVLAYFVVSAGAVGKSCDRLDQCRCEMSDGSGIINLRSIARNDGLPRWTISDNLGYWNYSYNPCIGFNSTQFSDLASVQQSVNNDEEYDIGAQVNEEFSLTIARGLAVTYLAHDYLRTTRVSLVCEPSYTDHDLLLIGETSSAEYEFILTSPCACPGFCDDNGLLPRSTTEEPPPTDPPTTTVPATTPTIDPNLPTCDKVDVCRCVMSDGEGEINLKSLARVDGLPRWTLNDSWYYWQYSYNPCVGFSGYLYSNLAVVQSNIANSAEEYDLGSQYYEEFIYRESEGVSVEYYAADYLRKSRVTLVCEPEAKDHELIFLGELIITEYEFVLTGPCACPGLCNDDGLLYPGTTTTLKTTTLKTTTMGGENPKPLPGSGVDWNIVSSTLVSHIFHDMIIIFTVVMVLLIMKFAFNQTCCVPTSNTTMKYSNQSAA